MRPLTDLEYCGLEHPERFDAPCVEVNGHPGDHESADGDRWNDWGELQ